jgi:octaprenyl-diphosphate synthase
LQNFLVKNKKIADKSSNNSLSTIIKKDLKLVNNFLTSNIKSEVPLIPLLSEYLLQSGGKRIRPALTILFSKLFGYKYGTRHIHLSACIEFIHMASLLHDDVVDESDLRRGKKTANKIWGNKASVLVGDYLFSKAFQIMVADKNIDILKNLSETSKTLAQGEVMQLSISNNIDVEKSKYFKVIQDKTAKLFSSSAIVGGIIANTSKNNIKKLDDFGNYIGVAFQLLDDALDYELSEKKIGKKTGDDFKEGKVTLPVILALEKSNKSEKLFWKRVIEELDQNKDDFKKAQDLLIKYNTLNETKLIAEKYAKKAKNLLKSFPKNIYNNALVELTDFVFNREN